MTKGYYTTLTDRSAVVVSGPDARDFLQGMVTQDVGLLAAQPLLYSALLTAQGKLHYDFFMWDMGDAIWLECESARADDLLSRLRMFTLRKNVSLKIEKIHVVAAWGCDEEITSFSFQRDPRHDALGYRRISSDPIDMTHINGIQRTDSKIYHKLHINFGVPYGSHDINWESDTVADLGLDKLGAVSYTKGCYMGQELTSRMHHRGLSKRGLYTVDIIGDAPRPFSDILADGNLIGEMRSHVGDRGLAILRHDSLGLLPKAGLRVEQAA